MSADEYDWSVEDLLRASEGTPQKRRHVPRHGVPRAKARAICQAVGKCELCGVPLDLVLDHDQALGELRGVLCGSCNLRLSGPWEDPEFLQRVIDYLNRPKSQRPRLPS